MLSILDILFPKTCVGCGKLGAYICTQCKKMLVVSTKFECLYCHKPHLLGETCNMCSTKYTLHSYVSLYNYTGIVKKIIRTIKYKKSFDIIKSFIDLSPIKVQTLLQEIAMKESSQIIFVPVPLHNVRYYDRGFNQSEYIAQYLTQITGFPTISHIVKRSKNTKPLALIQNRVDRELEIKDAFTIIDDTYKENIIILVDDVITSGSTVKELAKTFLRAKYTSIYALSIAKG